MKNKILISILLILFTILVIVLYGVFIEPKSFKTNEIKINSNYITDAFNGLKITHITDINYGTTVDEKFLKNIVDEINLLNSDIVVLTGDLLNKEVNYTDDDYNKIIELLSKINTKLGKYAIKGDNDTSDKWEDIIKKSDFTNLNDSYKLIFNNDNIPILLSGISSNNSSSDIKEKIIPIEEYIDSLSVKPCYSILLLHEPDYVDNINVNNYNLILAGHSVGGLNLFGIKRFNLPAGALKYAYGEYKINDSILYVSNGLGSNNVKFRIMNKPSINFYRITK